MEIHRTVRQIDVPLRILRIAQADEWDGERRLLESRVIQPTLACDFALNRRIMANVEVVLKLDQIVRLSSWDCSSSLCFSPAGGIRNNCLPYSREPVSRPIEPVACRNSGDRLRQQGSMAVPGRPVEQGVHKQGVGEDILCDYSLHAIRSRLAVQGERLMIHRFHTDSTGMAPVPEASEAPEVKVGFWRKLFCLDEKAHSAEYAICIPPGARLLLHNIPADLQRRAKAAETESVTFTQITARENTYRDAVRFESGLVVPAWLSSCVCTPEPSSETLFRKSKCQP